MSESTEQVQTADRLWQEFRREPFPDSLRHAAFGGAHVWLLELDIAGCVLRWLDSGGTLDPKNSLLLQNCIEGLEQVMPEIMDLEGAQYCRRLHQLAVLASRNPPGTE
ncbi:hypothetical protein OHA37_38340 [Streptomyces sp. NBC_00335]|uniref:hypothetical protein n=1 Tax=unclassified Streptomyces TaxID=2593676 RepID=UPI00225AD08E|nr:MULTISPECIES: hypothetical protein [unclassified Streptomyces]MCX5409705.1 hypothetical protein [Streptomyces sp. NBC_00086]